MVAKEWLSLLTGMFLAGIAVISVVLLARVVAYIKLHHSLACRRFKRRYRAAARPSTNWATTEVPALPSPLPVIRSRMPAGVGNAPAASAGPKHGRRSG